jgi:hypothetical protein
MKKEQADMTRYLLAPQTGLDDLERTSLTIDSYLHVEGGVREGARIETLWGHEDRPGRMIGWYLVWTDSSLGSSEFVHHQSTDTIVVYDTAVETHSLPEPQTLEQRIQRSIEIGLVQAARGQVIASGELRERLSRYLERIYANRFVLMAMRHPRKAALLAKTAAEAENADALSVSIEVVLHTRAIDLAAILAWSRFGLPRNEWSARALLQLREEARQFIRGDARLDAH